MDNKFTYVLFNCFCLFWPTQQYRGHCDLEGARRRFHPCACGLAHSPSVCTGPHQVLWIPPIAQKHMTFSWGDLGILIWCEWHYIKQKNGDGKWKDWHTCLNKNSLIVDAHLSLSKHMERKFTLMEISLTASKVESQKTAVVRKWSL